MQSIFMSVKKTVISDFITLLVCGAEVWPHCQIWIPHVLSPKGVVVFQKHPDTMADKFEKNTSPIHHTTFTQGSISPA